MKSFRTELENPVVEKDIVELEKKIQLFKNGEIDEERFRSLRLARGVYGQRQPGVQMVRIKVPFGQLTGKKLRTIADVSDEYSTGNLHITTRQDIQIHYVSLDRTPQLWEDLEQSDVTMREACGNTVRNVTASPDAGVAPGEAFDVSPYAHETFSFFLRNPICQEMGRKFKISFSSTNDDTALSYIHDLGFIPVLKDGKRGFQVMLGGGLGARPRHADKIYDFLPEDQLIPLIEAVLRVFDRYGERKKRFKARMKYLIEDIGVEEFLEMVEDQRTSLSHQSYHVNTSDFDFEPHLPQAKQKTVEIDNQSEYKFWLQTNAIPQKHENYYSVGIRVKLGDFSTDQARNLADIIEKYANDELRLTLRQNILIRNVHESYLPLVYTELAKIGLAKPGYEALSDITACPGTDTCNLGIASSTGIADKLEDVLLKEYPQYIDEKALTLKISGCMNGCGQHNMAHIGFQGMSVRTPEKLVAPALQVLLGGGVEGNGNGRFADKVIKVPSKRGPEALRRILNDFEENSATSRFLDYYDERGKRYFYDILKDLSSTDDLEEEDFVDWGNNEKYVQEVGVGECAGVVIDLVQTLMLEAREKLGLAQEALNEKRWADSIYNTYTGFVNSAKAMLTAKEIETNSQAGIIRTFQEHFVDTGEVELNSFPDLVYTMKKNEPTEAFANDYLEKAITFYNQLEELRKQQLSAEDE